MIRRAKRTLALTGFLFLVGGCGQRDLYTPQDVDVLVVDGVLLVDERLPTLRLSRTVSPDVSIVGSNAGESGATVQVWAEEGAVFAYTESAAEAGLYLPPDPSPLVRPEAEYHLRVSSARGEVLTATTLTPPRLAIDEWLILDDAAEETLGQLQTFDSVGDGVYTADENQLFWGAGILEARFTRSENVAAYQVALFSLDEDSDFAIEPDFFEEDDFADIDRSGASPMFEARDGFVRLPWFAVFFEGRYLTKIYATDRNWNDLVRTSPSLSDNGGFGGNAGESFGRPIFHVEGGIGLFGSASVDSIGFFVFDED